MKILAIEKENPGVTEEQCKPLLKPEAQKVWQLYKQGIIREIYFTQDTHEAESILSTLPLVKEKLIVFEIKPLIAYDGFERLFEK